MSGELLIIDPRDDVAVALRAVAAGESLSGVTAAADIPAGHKLARRAIAAGQPVRELCVI